MSFRQALAQQEAAKSEEVSPSQATPPPVSTTSAEGPSATSSSEDPDSHAASSSEGSLQPRNDAAMTAASSWERQSSTGRLPARRAWPVVNRRRGQESNGILVDKYSTVVSDSDTSEDEEVQQPAPLLGNISAKSIQSGWLLWQL